MLLVRYQTPQMHAYDNRKISGRRKDSKCLAVSAESKIMDGVLLSSDTLNLLAQ